MKRKAVEVLQEAETKNTLQMLAKALERYYENG